MLQSRLLVDESIRSRRAVRDFSAKPVAKSLIAELLEVARLAPSNSNTQPWFVHVLQGDPKHRLSAALAASHERDDLAPSSHFPPALPPACKSRQSDFGARYYAAAGIDRDDAAARHRQTGLNYSFFGAPVGLIFSIDESLTRHSWADYGMFLQTLMLAARSRGLDTCPQVSFVRHESVIREALGLPAGQTVVCGMSLGYARPDAALNLFPMPREPLENFAVFSGFEDSLDVAAGD